MATDRPRASVHVRAERDDIPVKAHLGERILSVRTDCGGSIDCVAEIHIDRVGTNGQEVHLNYEETRELRRLLKVAMRLQRERRHA